MIFSRWLVTCNSSFSIKKETKLPVKTDVAPYYHWKDVESYYREKLDKYQHI